MSSKKEWFFIVAFAGAAILGLVMNFHSYGYSCGISTLAIMILEFFSLVYFLSKNVSKEGARR